MAIAGRGGEMHDGIDAVERGADGVEVAEIGAMRLDARHGAAVQRAQRVLAVRVRTECGADEPPQSRHEDASWGQLALHLAIAAKVLRHRRTPAIERVLGRKIARLPGARLRNVIDVVEVLRPRAPWIAHVIEEIRPDDVTPEPPADGNARIVRALHTHRDL